MAWRRYRRRYYKSKKGGYPMYVRNKRTGWKATLFGITNKRAMRKDLATRGFEVISHWEYYGKKRPYKSYKSKKYKGYRYRYFKKGNFTYKIRSKSSLAKLKKWWKNYRHNKYGV